ncbi:aldehyde dehydrogenase (NADP(+)) [Marinomonas flavescens]|uniref:aldehyde dehydrogenase (NADP(+)) n=1 Tax=Marinomonas flavescens TaxID=2529379 RepID=UPI0010565A73|nr:aldehyde dehydrogenase (NADP(+)) [Marinomonas flavescens]
MKINGNMIIGFKKVKGSGASIKAKNPYTGQNIEPGFASANVELVDKACSLAWSAFKDYRHSTLKERASFLNAIASNIEGLGEVLISRAMLETGLPKARLEGERARTCSQLRLFASVVLEGKYLDIRIDEAMPDRKPLPRSDLRYQKIALGPVTIFGASNFPLAFSVAGGDTASALAAGAPVIVKAHSAHPGTSELVALAVQDAAKTTGMPEGVFSMLYGSGNEIGSALVKDHRIKAVGFTGSRSGGTALTTLAQQRKEPIPVYAEMSSINPVYLLPKALDHNAKNIAKNFVTAQTMGAGQFCTSPGLILAIDSDGLESFIKESKSLIEGSTSQTMLTEGIHNAFQHGVKQLIENKSVSLIARGETGEGESQCSPTLFEAKAADFIEQQELSNEIFGAATLILRCKDFDEVLNVTDSLEGQLTGAIHISEGDEVLASRLLKDLELKVGRVLFNGFGTGVEVCSSMVHGGPYPATSDSRTTSVGTAAIDRFLRPVCYQDVPQELLPGCSLNT